jgi:hypothetical protein
MYAVARQDIELVRVFLARGARAGDSVWGVSRYMLCIPCLFFVCSVSTSAHVVALAGQTELLRLLLNHDPSLASAVDDRSPFSCLG